MSLPSCSLTVFPLDSQEPTVLVRCTTRTNTGAITSVIRGTVQDIPSDLVSLIGCVLERTLALLPLMDTITTADTEPEDFGDDRL